jgi:hypothetical protein
MKTSELIGAALDWAVAKCEGHQWRCPWMLEKEGLKAWQNYEKAWGSPTPEFSTDWAQGGPIIEREKIRLDCAWHPQWTAQSPHTAKIDGYTSWVEGSTPLIAAMRCYVASKMGDEVEASKELT